MLTVLKWIAFIIAIVLVGLASWATAYVFDWQAAWVPWLVFVGYLLCIALAILLIRGVMIWNKRRHSDDALALRRQDAEEKQVLWSRRSSLNHRWKQMIGQLQKSKFKARGNPLYALPWYLMIGAPQSGKTAAIKGSKLSVPFSAQGTGVDQGMVGGSRWWFLEETLILDVPGHYAFHRDSTDRTEWRQFLSLLLKHRKHQPINGVVMTLAADTVLHSEIDELNEQASSLKGSLDDMVQRLGVNFPVYVLVTKCDQIQGLTKFYEHFPSDVLNQAMGVMNDRYAEQGVPEKFLDRAFRRMARRLDRLRLTVLGNVAALHIDAKALVFPDEFNALQSNLSHIVRLVFEKRSYQESPFFRGIFFSSAQQQGQPLSSVLPRIGFAEENLPLNGGNLSYFLRDFFGKVLRRDKNLVAHTRQAISVRSFTNNIGAVAWLMVCVIFGIFLGASFSSNLNVMRQSAREIPATVSVSGEFDNDMRNLDKFRQAIFSLVRRNEARWMPRFGLSQSRDVEQKLISIYTKKFFNYILNPIDRGLLRRVKKLHVRSEPLLIAQFIDLFSKRINLLEVVREQGEFDPSQYQKDLPSFNFMLGPGRIRGKKSQLPSQMKANYIAYLSWESEDSVLIQSEYEKQQANLKRILSQEDLGLNWLTAWANIQEHLADVTFKRFWGAELRNKHIYVPRAYTPKGWHAINKFIGKIQRVQVARDLIDLARKDYLKRYRHAYFMAWERFLENFHHGEALWRGRDQRLELAAKLSSADSPFLKVLREVSIATLPAIKLADDKDKQVPFWVWHVQRFILLQSPRYKQSLKGAEGVLGMGGKLLGSIKDQLAGSGENEESRFETDRKALPLVEAYISSIEQMSETAVARQAAFEVAKKAFAESTGIGILVEPKNPVLKNTYARKKLKRLISRTGRPEQEIFWQLLRHQFRILWSIILVEAQTHLQSLWSEDVMADVLNLDKALKKETLQAEGGKLWQFRDAQLKPFIQRFEAKTLYDERFHFNPKFLRALKAGPIKQVQLDKECKLTVHGYPTDTNRGAAVKPNLTSLTLSCGTEIVFAHVNNNPPPKVFTWKKSECGKVSLKMSVGTLELKREWEDFPSFINAFLRRQGRKVFYRREFDFQKRGQLTGYGIQQIIVHYGFRPKSQIRCVRGGGVPSVPDVPDRIIDAKYISR